MTIEDKIRQLNESSVELEQILVKRKKKAEKLWERIKSFFPASRKSVYELDTNLIKLTIGLLRANIEVLSIEEFLDAEDDDNIEGYA